MKKKMLNAAMAIFAIALLLSWVFHGTGVVKNDLKRNIYIPEDEIKRELRRGREQLHADKVIISGGEASIHPKFIEFVRYAKEIGYDRVQTVTNGMMLSKREFYNSAVEAGLYLVPKVIE